MLMFIKESFLLSTLFDLMHLDALVMFKMQESVFSVLFVKDEGFREEHGGHTDKGNK